MKELSIEEKAKLYDEAVEKFDVILNLNTVKESGTIFADDVRKMFPELKESEDERIRKAIKGVVSYNVGGNKIYGVSKEDMIAWLEKQGEQKPADKVEPKKWSDEEQQIIKNAASFILSCVNTAETKEEEERLERLADKLQDIRPQSQWKPSDEQMDALKSSTYCQNKQMSKVLFGLYQDLKKLKEK